MEQCKMTREEICEYLVKTRTEHECVHFKEIAVHLLVNTKGEATVTLVEEV